MNEMEHLINGSNHFYSQVAILFNRTCFVLYYFCLHIAATPIWDVLHYQEWMEEGRCVCVVMLHNIPNGDILSRKVPLIDIPSIGSRECGSCTLWIRTEGFLCESSVGGSCRGQLSHLLNLIFLQQIESSSESLMSCWRCLGKAIQACTLLHNGWCQVSSGVVWLLLREQAQVCWDRTEKATVAGLRAKCTAIASQQVFNE